MKANVRKWGNSLAIRIPKVLAEQLRLGPGAAVDISAEGGKLVVTPAGRPRFTLAGLMAEFDPAQQNELVDFGPPVGSEAW